MSVRLFVLGLVNTGETYGYEIKATAHLWGLERWAQIRDGSIYHALAKLEEEGLIEERRAEQSDNNRPRYVYSITDRGHEEFLKLLRETLSASPYEGRSIDLGLAFLTHLPPEERIALLNERQDRLHRARADLLQGFQNVSRYENLPAWVPVGMQHSLGRIEFEIEWNRQLIDTVGQWPYHP
jgi:DNA-binding PadR family transcriptional regulator